MEMIEIDQKEFIFFAEGQEPSNEEKRWMVNPDNPACAYSKFIGNRRAINKLSRSAYDAVGRHNHACRDLNWAIIGPKSTGKTTLAKLHAKVLDLPFVEFSPRSIITVQDLFDDIARCLIKDGIPLIPHHLKHNHFVLPPMIVFVDEVHALRNNIVQGLLKAVERSDAQLVTEKRMTADTHNVLWMIATTDRGLLFDAFDSRFSKVSLDLYSQEEISQIVALNFSEWEKETCDLVAHYCGIIPRESLAFAHEMNLEHNMSPNSWDVVASKVAEDNGIDPYGLTYQRLHVVTSLGQNGPVSASRMQYVANCKEEELKNFIMPYLMTETKDRPPLVTVTNKGYCVTKEGLKELDKRGISHIGDAALPPKPKLKGTGTTGLTYVP